MSFAIKTERVGLDYGSTTALRDVDLDLEPGRIYGLLGRNGSGKTSLLSLLAAFRKTTRGKVLVDGQDPFENPRVMPYACLVRESGDFDGADTARDSLDTCSLRPTWDEEYAMKLVDKWDIDLSKRVDQHSRGQRSLLAAVSGLASGADLVMFDEVHLGMDAPTRDSFYRELLEMYMDREPTVILSSHLIDEIADLLEEVVILDGGRVLLHESKEKLDTMGATLTGPAETVDAQTEGLEVLSRRKLGPTRSTTVAGLPDERRRTAREAGLEVTGIGLQDLFIHLTERNGQ
ncbi:ATP-binding cassette domain-containing protein [Salininema proteolyticum]|uniref:ATP-binding cassette domain-containing protein n=1 Tax=Salininema proteolyticum TaxID=1607685 RepID=A0ABV8U168_9ACTN